jgi:apolipoprotein N-acyltransferase
LKQAPPLDAQPDGSPVAIVQGNIDSGARWRSDLYGRNLEIYLRLTRSQLQEGAPEIVFWPEAAMTFFLEDEPLYRAAIARVLGPGGAELVAGGPFAFRDEDDTQRYFNSVFLMSPEGEILERYDKEYLVPFAEYFPLAGVDPLRRRFERVRVFTHGKESRLLPTRAGKAGVVICNEAMLPEVVSDRVAQGASYLINPSNDTWIGEPTFVGLQFDIIALRAVEQRRYLVRSSTSGPSAVIDPWGRVLVKTKPGVRSAIRGSIQARSDRSVYSRLGDLFAFLCLGIVILSLLVRPWRDPLERRHLWGRAGSNPATR